MLKLLNFWLDKPDRFEKIVLLLFKLLAVGFLVDKYWGIDAPVFTWLSKGMKGPILYENLIQYLFLFIVQWFFLWEICYNLAYSCISFLLSLIKGKEIIKNSRAISEFFAKRARNKKEPFDMLIFEWLCEFKDIEAELKNLRSRFLELFLMTVAIAFPVLNNYDFSNTNFLYFTVIAASSGFLGLTAISIIVRNGILLHKKALLEAYSQRAFIEKIYLSLVESNQIKKSYNVIFGKRIILESKADTINPQKIIFRLVRIDYQELGVEVLTTFTEGNDLSKVQDHHTVYVSNIVPSPAVSELFKKSLSNSYILFDDENGAENLETFIYRLRMRQVP